MKTCDKQRPQDNHLPHTEKFFFSFHSVVAPPIVTDIQHPILLLIPIVKKKFSCSLQFYPKLSLKKISANGRRQVVRVLYLVLITLAGPVKWRERKVWAAGNRRARKSHMIEAAKISCREGGGTQGVCHVFRKRNDQNVYRRNEKQKLLTRNLNNHEIYSKNS